MKKSVHLSLVLMAGLIFWISQPVQAQQRQVAKVITGKTHNNVQQADSKSRSQNFSKSTVSPTKQGNVVTDTLNYPLPGEYSIYFSDDGYVSGNNEFGDRAKANYFDNNSTLYVTGVLMEFAQATGSNETIEIALWDNSGANNSPGTKVATTTTPLNGIVNDVMNEEMTFVSFDSPVTVSSSFYVGVYLPLNSGDTLALWTNTDGDSDPAAAWELWSDNQWFAYDDANSWGLKITHAIFPIVTDEVGLMANFMADKTQITVGETVSFTDLSSGNPTSWMYDFPGGTPAQSSEQNPSVIYNEVGSYSVKLKVSDGQDSDSLTKSNYIVVTESGQEPEIDTLLYPLPGNYVIFTLNNNGGYVCGTNGYGDLAKANYYDNTMPGQITGILIEFVHAVGGNPDVEFALWSKGSDNKPGSKIGSSTVPLNTIKNDVMAQDLTYVEFNNPVPISGSFFAGFMIPTATNDTLVVWSNDDGDTNPGIAWELWEDETWYPFNQAPSWQINCALAIHPVIDYSTGIFDRNEIPFSVYPNPSVGIFRISESTSGTLPEEIAVYDVAGNFIKQQEIPASGEILIDLTDQQDGIYFLRLKAGSESYFSRIVKR